MRVRLTSFPVFLGSLVLGAVPAQVLASSAADGKDALGTVIIEGTRPDLTAMKAEIDRLDDAFYERFNELNTVPGYATQCFLHAPLGTRIQKRYCHPAFTSPSATGSDTSNTWSG